MFRFLVRWFINVLALILVMHILQGIRSDSWQTTVIAALVLGFINAFFRPLIILLTLPLNILSLGLLTFVINGLMFYLVSKIVKGFNIAGFASAFWGALLFSSISFLLNSFIQPENKINFSFHNRTPEKRNNNPEIIDVEGKIEDNKP